MIIGEQDVMYVSNVKSKSKEFTIQANSKAFEILSSQIYSNKVRAIVRELCCNAYDSHVEAGCPEKPFLVHLPSSWEPEFSVEDFGIGMSAEVLEELYTTYFASSKNMTNDLIGGLGLGSKSPFCYTDQFTVRTRKDGVECVYNAFINARKEPSVQLKSKRPTDEPNGFKVSLAVKTNDFGEFSKEAQNILSMFPVPADVIGQSVTIQTSDIVTKLQENDIVIQPKGYYDRKGFVVVMGNVAYNIPRSSAVFEKFSEEHRRMITRDDVDIYVRFDIGDLDVAASRETLSFDDESTEKFINKLESHLNGIVDKCQAELDEIPSLLGKHAHIRDNYFFDSVFDQGTKFEGKPMSYWFSQSMDSIISKQIAPDYITQTTPVYYLDGNENRKEGRMGQLGSQIRYSFNLPSNPDQSFTHVFFLFDDGTEGFPTRQQVGYWIQNEAHYKAKVVLLRKYETVNTDKTYVNTEGEEVFRTKQVVVAPEDSDIESVKENIEKWMGVVENYEPTFNFVDVQDIKDLWEERRQAIRAQSAATRKANKEKAARLAALGPKLPVAVSTDKPRYVKKFETRCMFVTPKTTEGKDFDYFLDLKENADKRILFLLATKSGELNTVHSGTFPFFLRGESTTKEMADYARFMCRAYKLDGVAYIRTRHMMDRVEKLLDDGEIENQYFIEKIGFDPILTDDELKEISFLSDIRNDYGYYTDEDSAEEWTTRIFSNWVQKVRSKDIYFYAREYEITMKLMRKNNPKIKAMKEFFEDLIESDSIPRKMLVTYKWEDGYSRAKHLEEFRDPDLSEDFVIAEQKKMFDKYPLLRYISSHADEDALVQYITLVDADLNSKEI